MSALREAFVDELKDLLDAERQLLKALPKLAKAAENEQLRAAFTEHQEQTAEQIRRLGRVFEAFEETPQGKKCKGMQGLIEEADEMIEEEEGDAALAEFMAEFAADREEMRLLVAAATAERRDGKPAGAGRQLFRRIKGILEPLPARD